MKKIYISGKISGEDLIECRKKFQDFEDKVNQDGIGLRIFANPFSFNNHLIERGDATWLDYMRNAISILVYCDEAHFLPDWVDSKGAQIEHQLCIDLGIKIVYG